MPVDIPIPRYIEYGKIAQFLSGVDAADDLIFKGAPIYPNHERLLYIVRSAVERAFVADPTDLTLNLTGEYLYALCGKYLFSDLIESIGGESGGAIVFQHNEWYVLAYKVPPGSAMIDGYTFQDDRLKNADNVVDLILNKVPETIVDGDFTFDRETGTVTRTNKFFEGDTIIIRYSKIIISHA